MDSLLDLEQKSFLPQGVFRPDYSFSDVLMLLRKVSRKAGEWRENVWVARFGIETAYHKAQDSSDINALAQKPMELTRM